LHERRQWTGCYRSSGISISSIGDVRGIASQVGRNGYQFQIAGVEGPVHFFGNCALATAVMCQCQKLDGDLALLVGKIVDKGLESCAIILTREELVAINEAAERPRLFAQGMGDVVVVDDLVVPPVSVAASPAQCHQMRTSDKENHPIVKQANS
jgi:hypothetical protein